RVTLDALTVHFGETPVHNQPAVTQKVLATLQVPAEHLEVTVNPPVATIEVKRRTDPPEQVEVLIRPHPTLAPGPFKAEALLEVRTSPGERHYGAKLPVSGNMQPEVRALPARLLLGSKPVGQTAEAVVVLQAPPDAKIVIERIESDSPDLHAEPASIDGSPPNRTFRVRQQVTKEGEQSTSVRFFVSRDGQPAAALMMEV